MSAVVKGKGREGKVGKQEEVDGQVHTRHTNRETRARLGTPGTAAALQGRRAAAMGGWQGRVGCKRLSPRRESVSFVACLRE